jgi:hypothetical protein
MLPAEKSERWAWRIGIAVLVLVILYVVVWVARNVSYNLRRIHGAYEQDTSRALGAERI